MIVKGMTRNISTRWIRHIANAEDNEEVRIVDNRGLAGQNIADAIEEMQAYAVGTRCKEALFEVITRPDHDHPATHEQFMRVVELVEQTYPELQHCTRLVVEHFKDGTAHRHVVYGRCYPGHRAAALPFTKTKLMEISAQSFIERGAPMPEGVRAFVAAKTPEQRKAKKSSKDVDLSTFKTAERQGIDARDLSAIACKAWQEGTFVKAMRDNGYAVATGDRRGYVLVDTDGQHIGLRGLLKPLNLKAKDLTAALGAAPSIEDARRSIAPVDKKPNPEITALQEAAAAKKSAIDAVKTKHRRQQAEFDMTLDDVFEIVARKDVLHLEIVMDKGPVALDPKRPIAPQWGAVRGQLLNEQRDERRPMVEAARLIRQGLKRLNLMEHGKRVFDWMLAQRQAIERHLQQQAAAREAARVAAEKAAAAKAAKKAAIDAGFAPVAKPGQTRSDFDQAATSTSREAPDPIWREVQEAKRRAKLEQEFRDQVAADEAAAAAAKAAADRKAAIPASTLGDQQPQPASRVEKATEAQTKQREERLAGRTGRGGGGRSHTPQIKKPSGPSV